MGEVGYSCVQPAKGIISPEAKHAPVETQIEKEEMGMQARVGKPAPDFEANAFVDGGFKTIKLSDYKGQWVVLCF